MLQSENSGLQVAQLIHIEDEPDIGKSAKLQFSSDDNISASAQDEIIYLQQEMAELATAIKVSITANAISHCGC